MKDTGFDEHVNCAQDTSDEHVPPDDIQTQDALHVCIDQNPMRSSSSQGQPDDSQIHTSADHITESALEQDIDFAQQQQQHELTGQQISEISVKSDLSNSTCPVSQQGTCSDHLQQRSAVQQVISQNSDTLIQESIADHVLEQHTNQPGLAPHQHINAQ